MARGYVSMLRNACEAGLTGSHKPSLHGQGSEESELGSNQDIPEDEVGWYSIGTSVAIGLNFSGRMAYFVSWKC